MAQIFISYRRADSDVIAGRIRDRLVSTYGDKSIFMDIDNIPYGVDFRSHVKDVLSRGDILIAVIGPNWLGIDSNGTGRFDDEADPVRVELEAALQRKMPVIPVLVQGAKMPAPGQLPPLLRDFAFYNAANVDAGRDFHPHLDRLIQTINPLLKRHPARRYGLWAAAGSLIVCTTIAVVFALRQLSIFSPAPAPPVKSPPSQESSDRSAIQKAPQEPWHAALSIGLPELRASVDKFRNTGYRLQSITGYLVDGTARYAMLWDRGNNQGDSGGWEYDTAAYDKRQIELTASGRHPIFLSAYEGTSGIRYATSWTSGRSAQWEIRREMSAETLRAAIRELAQRGLHPVHVYGFAAAGQSQFVAIFERQTGEANIVGIDTPATETQKDWDSRLKDGYRPRSISGYRISNIDYLTTLWEKGPNWSSQFGIMEKNVDSIISARKGQGLHLIYLTAYSGLGGPRYNMIWDKR